MSAATWIRRAAEELEANAGHTGRRDQRVAAKHLHALADKLQRQADRKRDEKRRRRGTTRDRQGRPIDQSPAASGDLVEGPRRRVGQRWQAVAGDHEEAIQLQRVGRKGHVHKDRR